MSYSPPASPLEVHAHLTLDEAIGPDDPRWVNTDEARGEDIQKQIARKFSVDMMSRKVLAPTRRHVLLFGPIGCGKTTELLRFAASLRTSNLLYPVQLNVRNELDVNNLQYADVLMALSAAVVNALSKERVAIAAEHTARLENWFKERVLADEKVSEFSGQLKSEVSAELGIPFLAKLMTKATAMFKNTSTHKDTLREVVKNNFSEFASAFNELSAAANDAVKAAGLGERLLLIVDGTDKIPMEQARELFVHNTEQLKAINALVLYTAPISLKYDGTTGTPLDADLVLPILKLQHQDGSPNPVGLDTLRDLLLRRIAASAFASPASIDALVLASGGHPRELLRLLRLTCEIADAETIREADVERALDKLAADFRYWLQPEDYALLVAADREASPHGGNDERIANLLLRIALLQYNGGAWRRANPVVRRLEGYKRATANPGPSSAAV